jgi:hypothetical protein
MLTCTYVEAISGLDIAFLSSTYIHSGTVIWRGLVVWIAAMDTGTRQNSQSISHMYVCIGMKLSHPYDISHSAISVLRCNIDYQNVDFI